MPNKKLREEMAQASLRMASAINRSEAGEVAEYYDDHTSEYTPIKAERLIKKEG